MPLTQVHSWRHWDLAWVPIRNKWKYNLRHRSVNSVSLQTLEIFKNRITDHEYMYMFFTFFPPFGSVKYSDSHELLIAIKEPIIGRNMKFMTGQEIKKFLNEMLYLVDFLKSIIITMSRQFSTKQMKGKAGYLNLLQLFWILCVQNSLCDKSVTYILVLIAFPMLLSVNMYKVCVFH